ncbi:MAG: hypothetical protein ACO20H_09430 [Bacteriovoracaceae bacterium]
MKFILCFLLMAFSTAKADVFNINLMAYYTSQTLYKGAQVWPKSSFLAAPGLQFFDRKLSIYGPNISWKFHSSKEDPFKVTTGARYWDDDRPLIRLAEGDEDYRNQRSSILEYYIKSEYNFGWKNKFGVGVYIGRELVRYKKWYFDFHAKAPILPFTSLVGTISHAQGDTNRYLYGPEAVSGWGYASLGIRFVIPFVPWDGIIINNLDKTWVLQGANKNADYVRSNSDHLSFNTRWVWNAF